MNWRLFGLVYRVTPETVAKTYQRLNLITFELDLPGIFKGGGP